MKKTSLHLTLAIILIATASFTFAGCTQSAKQPSSQSDTTKSETIESPFVMTDDANGVTKTSESQIMYKTDKDLEGVLDFYREKLTAKDLKEREILTVQSDTTLNLVFDGSENNQAIVIQAVIIGDYTNVTVRYEEI